MIRYETKDKARFWEIVVDGCELWTRSGAVGSDGRTIEPRSHPSEEKAAAEAQKRIAQIEKKGYERVPVVDEAEQATNPELEQTLLDDPYDDAAFLVYADWLQSQGDPRGELATLQHAARARVSAEQPSPPAKLKKAETKLLKEQGARLLPPRFAEALAKRRTKGKADSGYCELQWRAGFIRSARVGRNSPRPPHTVRELTATLLAHPSARFLAELTIGALGTKDNYDYSEVVRALCVARPRALRRLVLADYSAEEHADPAWARLGDLSDLWAAVPRLEQLTLRSATMTLGQIELPELRAFSIESTKIDRLLPDVARARWPKLERLALRCADAEISAGNLEPLLARRDLERLRELAIVRVENGPRLCGVLADSPLAGQLERLDLRDDALDDASIELLLAGKERLARLVRVDLDGNRLSEAGARAAADLCAEVVIGTQRDPDAIDLREADIRAFAPDPRSMTAARKVANPGSWPRLGRDGGRLWGECRGSTDYEVFADVDLEDAGCTCPSFKYPCKHAIGLLLLAAGGHSFDERAVPSGLVDRCEESRYEGAWE